MRNVFFTIIAVVGILMSSSASSTIIFDFDGTCSVDCSRFGIADGTAFSESGALGLFDGTDTSSGSDLLITDIEFFNFMGLDFLSGHTNLLLSAANIGFTANDVLGGFLLGSSGNNSFCYNFVSATCDGGRFDTNVGLGTAVGALGHGPGQFTKANHVSVSTPTTLAIFALGLIGLCVSKRSRAK